jgi:hexosaminidase
MASQRLLALEARLLAARALMYHVCLAAPMPAALGRLQAQDVNYRPLDGPP